LNDDGAIVFHATVAGVEGLGVYRWQEGEITAIAVPGRAVPRAGRLEQAFYPRIDDRGRVVFVGRTRRGDGLYRWEAGAVTPRLPDRRLVRPGLERQRPTPVCGPADGPPVPGPRDAQAPGGALPLAAGRHRHARRLIAPAAAAVDRRAARLLWLLLRFGALRA